MGENLDELQVSVWHVSTYFEMPTLDFLGFLLKTERVTCDLNFELQYILFTHSMESLGLVMDLNRVMTFSVSRFHTFNSPSKLPVAR